MKISKLILFALLCVHIHAQVTSDALRFSNTNPIGTARFAGVSGAMGALGGDYNAALINPAGIGVYRKADLAFSLMDVENIQTAKLQSNLAINKEIKKNKNKLYFNGFGLVFGKNPIGSNWERWNLMIGYNNTDNYRKLMQFDGLSQGTIIDRFLEKSLDPTKEGTAGLNPNKLDNFESGLAYEVGAIFDPTPNDKEYNYIHDLLPYKNYSTNKSMLLEESGKSNNLNIGFGSNYKNKLFIGMNLNLPTMEYNFTKNYVEQVGKNQVSSPFANLKFEEKLSQSGSGINSNIGIIYRPVQQLRFGISYQSPSLMTIEEKFNTALTYDYYDSKGILNSNQAKSPDGSFNYVFITPQHVTGSLAFVSRYGFISADVNYKDLTQSRFNFINSESSFEDQKYEIFLNADIKKQYKAVLKTNIGVELSLKKLRLRGGTTISQSSYSNDDTWNRSYSCGIGYRGNKSYIDFSIGKNSRNENYIPYLTGNSDFNGDGTIDAVTPIVDTKLTSYQYMITLGFKL